MASHFSWRFRLVLDPNEREFLQIFFWGVPLYALWSLVGGHVLFWLTWLGWLLLLSQIVLREICGRLGFYWTYYEAAFSDPWYLWWGFWPRGVREGQLRGVADRRGAIWYLIGAWLGCPKCLEERVHVFFAEKRYRLLIYYQAKVRTAQYHYYVGKIYWIQRQREKARRAWLAGSQVKPSDGQKYHVLQCLRSLIGQTESIEEKKIYWAQGAELGDLNCRFKTAIFGPIREQFVRLMDLANEHYFSAAADLVGRAYLTKNYALNILLTYPEADVNLRDIETLLRWKEYDYLDGLTHRLYDRYSTYSRFARLLLQIDKRYLSGKVLAVRQQAVQRLMAAASSLQATCVRDIIQLVADYI